MPERGNVNAPCFACGSAHTAVFHEQSAIPTNSCLLVDTEGDALAFPRGDLSLVCCSTCGFIFNSAFDPGKAEYSGRYEETQAFSPRFVEFASGLARRWVDEHDLVGKTVLEIGCGKGEFLSLMAESGIGRGIGIDPGVDVTRLKGPGVERCEWIPALFDDDLVAQRGPDLVADAIVCRHTLEHIQPVGVFLDSIRRFIGDRRESVVLFELPDTQRVLDEVAFWDVYYEHCSYFTTGSLARLFESHGFEVTDIRLAYDDQYLLLEARPVESAQRAGVGPTNDLEAIRTGMQKFHEGFGTVVDGWTSKLESLTRSGGKAVIWGAGSKGVSFLSLVGGAVAAAVDINPHKHGKFMAGTGHRIMAPAELVELAPDLVIAMNPVYLEEIQTDLDALGLSAELTAL